MSPTGTVESITPDWHVIGAGDINGDSKADIIWQNDNGSVSAWLMSGNVHTSSVSLSGPGLLDWHLVHGTLGEASTAWLVT